MDDIERAQERQLFDTKLALRAHETHPGTGVSQARPKLIDTETGEKLCWQCNEPIEPGRLAHNPDARLCGTCQTQIEDRHKRLRFR